MPAIRPLVPADNAQVLALNAQARPQVAALDGAELERLRGLSQVHLVAEEDAVLVGYLLAFARNHAYDGEEFLTLRSLIPQPFVYIDQIVVADSAHRAGIGGRLYGAVTQSALLLGAHRLCCEVNTNPPNPRSMAFHERLGFSAMVSLTTRDGREVALLQKHLSELGASRPT